MKKLLIIILFKSIFVFSIFASFNVSEIEKRVFENINQIDISNIGKVKQLNNSLDSLISLNKDNRGNYQRLWGLYRGIIPKPHHFWCYLSLLLYHLFLCN